MATERQNHTIVRTPEREWLEFQFSTYSRIAMRKHGISIPVVELTAITDESLIDRVKLLQELAHLPPG